MPEKVRVGNIYYIHMNSESSRRDQAITLLHYPVDTHAVKIIF